MAENTIQWSSFPSTPSVKNYNTREELEETRRQIEAEAEAGVFDSLETFTKFLGDVKEEGFFMAVYDKSFGQIFVDTLYDICRSICLFILGNGDLFFLMPAIVFMIGTFMVGRNKFTKWIIPCWFFYFLSRVFFRMLL